MSWEVGRLKLLLPTLTIIHVNMSSLELDTELDLEISSGFGSSPLLQNPSLGRRTKKRWSFNFNSKPNLIDRTPGTPMRRRLSDVTGCDAVHKQIDPHHISPAQLYSTESGRLFHAGKICIALAGLPGRGKTHLSVSLTRYLRWLGVKTHSFHLSNYRRAAAAADDLDHVSYVLRPQDSKEAIFRDTAVENCLNDILNFFETDKGQVAIYDAVNAAPEYRKQLNERFQDANIQCIFIELTVTDENMLKKNMESAARSSPDYENWDYEEAYKDYSKRINALSPYYIEMTRASEFSSLSYIKMINFGQRIELHNSNYGYLINKVVFFLMNSRIKLGSVYFARCYKNEWDYSKDPPLDENGIQYAKDLTDTMIRHLESKGRLCFGADKSELMAPKLKSALSIDEKHPPTGADGVEDDSFVVWTSVKTRTIQTTQFFRERGVNIRHRIQLSQKNPGVVGTMAEEEIRKNFPSEYELFLADPYHHRFSRSELYHDLAIKIEPLILEMERMSGDILIIADETVLRVLHGYLMACSCYDIPWLEFSTDEIVEVKFNAYSNTARRISIEKAS